MVRAGSTDGETIKKDIWPDLCLYCMRHYERKDVDPMDIVDKTRKYAHVLHKQITGKSAGWHRSLEYPDSGEIHAHVLKLIQLKNRRYRAGRKLAEKKEKAAAFQV